jgi:hypothetical protein
VGVSILVVTQTAYLRVYQPLSLFSESDRERWMAGRDDEDSGEHESTRRWLLFSALPGGPVATRSTEGAFVREVDGRVYVCPWRTRLRMLAGLVAFRGSIPEEVANAFVPEDEARRAAKELAELEDQDPEVRSHIVHANWHVPLRWFSAFDESQRILTEDRRGLRIRYEAPLSEAKARMARAVEILESSWIDDGIVASIKELTEWLEGFPEEGLLELDYGTVAATFRDEDLVEDHSAAEVWACLDALETGDVIRAGRVFGKLTDRWTEVRAREVVN